MMQVYVLGVGGVGGYLVERLPMVISSLSLDVLEQDDISIDQYLENAGHVALPCVVDRLVLVDGDTFNARNALRQGAGAGGKLVSRMRLFKAIVEKRKKAAETVLPVVEELAKLTPEQLAELDAAEDALTGKHHVTAELIASMQRSILKASFLQNMQLVGFNEYVKPSNMERIIPYDPPVNEENLRCVTSVDNLIKKYFPHGTSVVFLCIDNKIGRYEISKYMENFDNCLVLNGGNDKTVGHVTVYERKDGVELDPALYRVHPDITADADKRPDEDNCEVVKPQHDQIAVTNSLIADVMLARYITWARKGLYTGKDNKKRHNEVMLDIDAPSMMPLYHPN